MRVAGALLVDRGLRAGLLLLGMIKPIEAALQSTPRPAREHGYESLPPLMERVFGHHDCVVFTRGVIAVGEIAGGDELVVKGRLTRPPEPRLHPAHHFAGDRLHRGGRAGVGVNANGNLHPPRRCRAVSRLGNRRRLQGKTDAGRAR
ncbi:MAG: hypothetical protein QOH65_1360 [Methylobacteriaceae bacterium]|nr:hypothetical protein [Methylobacteriaceae bacterium]